MTDTTSSNIVRRVRYTPMRDILRWRWSGRLDWRRQIAAVDLPVEIKQVVGRVVGRMWLWKLEKAEVAEELIAHFTDGIEAGQSEAELIVKFGDERQAARLIARATRRRRSPLIRSIAFFRWPIAAGILFYLILVALFFLGRPQVKVNYVQVLNRSILTTPVDQRAWPIYRQAALQMGLISRPVDGRGDGSPAVIKLLEIQPNDKNWPAAVKWLDEHASAIAMVRQAANKPALGFILGPNGSGNDPQLWPPETNEAKGMRRATAHDPFFYVQVPYLQTSRQCMVVLSADAQAAALAGQGNRFVSDIQAAERLATQIWATKMYVSSEISIGIRYAALQQVEQTLADHPDALSDTELQELAHLLSRSRVAADLVDVQNERLSFLDFVQRMYTDDGHGNGYITSAAFGFLASLDSHLDQPPPLWSDRLARPFSVILCPSRHQVIEQYDRLMDLANANLHLPMRQAKWEKYDRELARASRRTERTFRLFNLVPQTLSSIRGSAERYLGTRDGAVVAVALEIYRRHQGHYPAVLPELVPSLLPAVPADRITGKPVRYKLVSGKPLIYSVGADRVDNGGQPARLPNGEINLSASSWDESPKDAPRGDWVLYPWMR